MIMGAEIGMLIVETIAKIRRAFFVQGKPIKAICRELRISRKVVRKVLRSEATEFRYEREAQPLPKIGPWSDKLDQLLLANECKASRERLIGSIRRECLDHIIIFNESHLRRVLSSYFQYHHKSRTHLSLGKDCPQPRPIQPPSAGKIIAFPEVGGLHHRYERRAA